MNQKGFVGVIILVVTLLVGLTVGVYYLGKTNNKPQTQQANIPVASLTSQKSVNYTITPTPSSKVIYSPSMSPSTTSFPLPPKQASATNVYTLEIDSNTDLLDKTKVAQSFYQKYPDNYDFLAIFPSFALKNEIDGISYSSDIQNNIRGICRAIRPPCSWGACGSNKLLAMQVFSHKNNNYDQLVNTPETLGNTLLHEIAHHWGVSLARDLWGDNKVRDGINQSCFSRGIPVSKQESEHWAYGLQSPPGALDPIEDSHPWVDLGNGIYSYDVSLYNKPEKYHPFDLYLMGLMDASEIKDSYLLLTNTQTNFDFSLLNGHTLSNNELAVKADAIRVSINDIINIAGQERNPKAADSQKDFRVAYVILTKQGEAPSSNMTKAIEELSAVFPSQWAYATGNRSTMNK